jgi:hypothetical protein
MKPIRQFLCPIYRIAADIKTFLFACLLGFALFSGFGIAQSAPAKYPDSLVADGFYRTVFGSEIRALSWGSQTNRVKKYVTPIKIWIDNRSRVNRKAQVRRFVASLPLYIPALRLSLVKNRKDANFRIFIVDRKDYANTVRKEIFRNDSIDVPGQCIVRVLSRRSGILGSDAVLVANQGKNLFQRCMVEEILQGLGPVNDDDSLTYSVFNDRSRFDYFTRFDRLILNMLYNKRVKPGMTRRQVEPITKQILRDAKAIVSRRP